MQEEQCKIFEVINKDSLSPLILTCEHATSYIPEGYNNLGLSSSQLNTHIARDKGCKELTVALAQKLGCTAFLASVSRLFIDYNRRETDAGLILDESDKILIPANANLSEAERNCRIKNYHRPYYSAINNKIAELNSKGIPPKILSIHGFTPQLRGGTFRPWHAGILYVTPNELTEKLLNTLQKEPSLKVGANVPYDMREYNTGAAAICGEDRGLVNAVIEIRDTEFEDIPAGTQKWCDLLINILI